MVVILKYIINVYKLKVSGVDVYKHPQIKKNKNLKFKLGSIYKIPFENETFDYVYLHDVLHYIDEVNQSRQKHIEGLLELKRVTKKDGTVIIIEGNRYNPLFYPHMVKMLGHNHFKQAYFLDLIRQVFVGARFKHFESHSYPQKFLWFWKMYETIMEKFSPKSLLAYNVAIIKKKLERLVMELT